MGLWSNITTWVASKIRPPTTTVTHVPPTTITRTISPPPSPTPTPPAPAAPPPTSGGRGITTRQPTGYEILTQQSVSPDPFVRAGVTTTPIISSGGSVSRLAGGSSYVSQGVGEEETPTKIIHTLEAAPTRGEQYRLAREKRGQIQGTLWYGGQKISGWLSTSKYSPVKDSGLQKPVGKLGAGVTEYGGYFIPYVGASLLVGTGIETAGTKAGRARIGSTSTILEENYNVPKYVSTPAQYTLAAGEIFIGGKGLKAVASKALKLPRSSVRLTGTQTVKGDTVISQADVKIDTKTLFGTRTRYGEVSTKTYFKPTESGKYVVGDSTTWARTYKPSKLNLPKGQTRIGDVQISQSFTKSATKEATITEYFTERGFKISRDVKGFHTGFGGRGAYAPPKKIFDKPKKFAYVGKGGSYDVGDTTKIFGRSSLVKEGEVLKIGRTEYTGSIRKIDLPTDTKIMFKTGTTLKPPKQFFAEESQKLAAGVSAPQLSASTSIPSFKLLPTTQVKTPTVQITPLKTDTLTSTKLSTVQEVTPITRTRTGLITPSVLKSGTRIGLVQPTATTTIIKTSS